MKKIIALTSILAISSVAMAELQSGSEPSKTEVPNVPILKTPAPQVQQPGAQLPQLSRQALDMGKRAFAGEPGRRSERNSGRNHYCAMYKMPYHQGAMQPQGFIDPALIVKDAKSALEAKDRSFVILEGTITKQVNDTEYTFVDASGEIKIDVPPFVWNGLALGPQDKVRIEGMLDKRWDIPEIKVRQVVKTDK